MGFAVIMAWRVRKTNPVFAFFIGWFLLLHAPESSVVPIMDILVEYRVYLSSAGLYAVAMMALVSLRADNRLKIAAASAAVLMFCTLTFSRNAVWADSVTLWADAAKKAPYSARAFVNWGDALMARNEYKEAITQLDKALEIEKDTNERNIIYLNLGESYIATRDTVKAEEYFGKVIALDNAYIALNAYESLGEMYFQAERYSDSARVFRRITEISKGNPEAHYNLAVSYMMLGRYIEAGDQMETVLGLSLDNSEVRLNLSRIYQRLGDRIKAVANAERAASMAADSEQAAEAERVLKELEF
jgi:tetratricopeptide (TPR) repeat protein